jgi:lysophospholipase L1-like esterase
VTVAGDSIALGLGIAMRDAADDGLVDDGPADDGAGGDPVPVRAIGEDGTGLARPDNFDWPGRLAELARDFPPGTLVFSVGSNDAQDLTDSSGMTVATMADEEAWDEEYERRLAAVFDAFEDTGTTVVWVGHARPAQEWVGEMNRHIHELATEVAATRDWVQVQDLAELTGSGADGPSECLSEDGLHLNATCYAGAAETLLDRLGLA